MRFLEFKKSLENKEIFSVYLFEGEDVFFFKRALKLLKTSLAIDEVLNYSSFDGGTVKTGELLSALSAVSFMGEYRLTVVNEYYPKTEELKGIENFYKNSDGKSILAVFNNKSCEQLKQSILDACVVECNKQLPSVIARWIKAECENCSVNVDGETASLIAEYCLCDMTRIEMETQKLISYCANKKVISIEDVVELVNKDAEYKIYEMTEYIAKRNYDKAIEVIFDMLSKGENEQKLLINVYNYFRRLLFVSISDLDGEALSKSLGVQEYAVRKAKEQSKLFKKRSLKQAVDLFTDSDFKIKTGLAVGENAFWRNIFKIMSE